MDSKIKNILADYTPELTSDRLFMARLERNMQTVELLKAQLERNHKNHRKAVIAAGFTGFLFGIIVTIFYPLIAECVENIGYMLGFANADIIKGYQNLVAWILICVVGCVMTFTAYDLTLSPTSMAESSNHERYKPQY